jgi:hypothetical protein
MVRGNERTKNSAEINERGGDTEVLFVQRTFEIQENKLVTPHSPACGHCEKFLAPETGLVIDYVVLPGVIIKIHLHRECTPEWCSQFGVPLPHTSPTVEGSSAQAI